MTRGPGADRERPPGPRTLPFVGTAVSFVRDPFGFRESCAREFGDVVDISALGRRAYLLTHPDDVERVLVADQNRFVKPRFEMGFVDDVFGRGLSFLDGPAWRERRQRLQPAFRPDRLLGYTGVMADCTEDAVAAWDDEQVVALDEEMTALTFRVLCRALFGRDLANAGPGLRTAFEGVNDRHRIPQVVVPRWVPTRTNRRYRAAVARLEATIDDLIRSHASRRATESTDEADAEPDHLLGILTGERDDHEALPRTAVRDELMGFLFAGHETTAVGLTFALLLLSANPGVRDALYSRLREVADDRPPEPAALDDVLLLDRVISEALRLFPPSHSVARETAEDVTIGGYHVPEGSSVHLPQWVVHRDPRWYDDPASFDPDRWTPQRSSDRPEYAFFPFGGGPRRCIGMHFARLELRIALATILLECTIDVADHDPPLEAGLTLRPADAVEATVRKRGGRRGE